MLDAALALAILGLLVAAGLTLAPVVMEGMRARATDQRLARVEAALLAHLAETGRLPCPAVAGGDQPAGLAAACPLRPPEARATPSARFVLGLVPWWSLGLMPEDGQDGRGRPLVYAVALTAVEGGMVCAAATLGDPVHGQGAIAVVSDPAGPRPAPVDRAVFALIAPESGVVIPPVEGAGAGAVRFGSGEDPDQALNATGPALAGAGLRWLPPAPLLAALGCLGR